MKKKRTKKAIEESNDIRRRIEEIEVRIRASEQSIEQSLVVQAASFMRVAELASDKNKMIIYQAQVKILKDLLMLYREINSRVSFYLSDDKVYQARKEVHKIREEMLELVEEDVVLISITRAEDLVKKSGAIMLNLKKYKFGEENYKRLEQEVNNLIEQEAQARQRAEQMAEQEAQARQRAEQTAEQEAQARQRAEQTAEQEAQRAARLEEMLRRMGVDPDTALDDVNVSQGASAGIGKGSGAGV